MDSQFSYTYSVALGELLYSLIGVMTKPYLRYLQYKGERRRERERLIMERRKRI